MAKAKQTGEVFEITDMSAPILTEMQKAALAGASQSAAAWVWSQLIPETVRAQAVSNTIVPNSSSQFNMNTKLGFTAHVAQTKNEVVSS